MGEALDSPTRGVEPRLSLRQRYGLAIMEEIAPPTQRGEADSQDRFSSLVEPPRPGVHDTCLWCCTPLLDSEGMCENCANHRRVLRSLTPLCPISLYHRETPLREWVTGYKPDLREEHDLISPDHEGSAQMIRHMLSNFFVANNWLTSGTDALLVVPSTDRLPPHPLEGVLTQTFAAGLLRPQALKRTEAPLRHRMPHLAAYEATIDLHDQRVVLIDDVYASGARLQSAAAAITEAGGQVAAAIVIARRINLGYDARVEEMWNRQSTMPFTWNRSAWIREPSPIGAPLPG